MLNELRLRSTNIGGLIQFLNNKKNKDYVNFIDNNIPSDISSEKMTIKLYYLLNDIKEVQRCRCNKLLGFIGFKGGFRKTCGDKKCYVESRRETCLKNFGVDNPIKSEEIKIKIQENILNNWGGEHYLKNEEVKDKFKKTMISKYGVEWAQQSKDIKLKSLETWNKNENKDEIIRIRSNKIKTKTKQEKENIRLKKIETIESKFGSYDEFLKLRLDKIKNTSLIKWGVDHHFKSHDIVKKRTESYINKITNKIIESLPTHILYRGRKPNENNTNNIILLTCNKCTNDFEITRQLLQHRNQLIDEVCLICNPILSGQSKSEIEVLDFIKSNFEGNVIHKENKIISGEIDIYLPSINVGIEYNGLYWHSDSYKEKDYHINKTIECKEKGIKLIHIWEDDWLYKKEIVKSIINNKLNIINNKIYARNCEIKELDDNSIIRDFLDKNHLQGFVGSKYKIGLFYKNELVSLMTFGNLRIITNQKAKDNTFELLRFCNKINTVVPGGASKLFNFFIQKYKPKQIISYCDISRYEGTMYQKLGFELKTTSSPNYYYIIDGIRRHRFNFRKSTHTTVNQTEMQIMKTLRYTRIYDCGTQKWSWNNNI